MTSASAACVSLTHASAQPGASLGRDRPRGSAPPAHHCGDPGKVLSFLQNKRTSKKEPCWGEDTLGQR